MSAIRTNRATFDVITDHLQLPDAEFQYPTVEFDEASGSWSGQDCRRRRALTTAPIHTSSATEKSWVRPSTTR